MQTDLFLFFLYPEARSLEQITTVVYFRISNHSNYDKISLKLFCFVSCMTRHLLELILTITLSNSLASAKLRRVFPWLCRAPESASISESLVKYYLFYSYVIHTDITALWFKITLCY